MNFKKVIKLFLFDGSPNKRLRCELSNWTGVAYKIPRNMVKTSDDRTELHSPGVYFLFGFDETNDRQLVYIGEAEDIIKRLKDHLLRKDNWNEAIAFISKDENLNKAHIKYLEHEFYSLANESGRYTVDNSNIPTKSSVSESDQGELEEFIYNAKILVNALGHKVFDPVTENIDSANQKELQFQISAGNGKAYCMQTADGFVLLKGSCIHKNSADSLNNAIKKKVEQCRENGTIKDGILQKDLLFSSSSTAAAFAVGYSVSGPQQWKTSSGKTLKSIETKSNT